MKLSELGERRIIDIFVKNLAKNEDALVGIGDDACVLRFGNDYLVVSTDLIVQKTHIPREMTPSQIGRYAVNVNLSDIAAMGAAPLGLVFSFGLPRSLDESFVKELSKGINQACREHNTHVLGGDTKEHVEITIAGTAFGKAHNRILARSGAKVGDLICVTGTVGSAAAGFYCLTKNLTIKRFIDIALEPRARIQEGLILAKYASACIDVSDGLAYSIHEIARASGMGFLIQEEAVPMERGIEEVSMAVNVPIRELLFFKGGDYELLFTIPQGKFDAAAAEMKRLGTQLSVIGEVVKKGTKIISEGKEEELDARGYEAFFNFP
ncbi:MAG: thiamine-phosphate kinase [Candidatus Hydrothermarchaeales archaeon]